MNSFNKLDLGIMTRTLCETWEFGVRRRVGEHVVPEMLDQTGREDLNFPQVSIPSHPRNKSSYSDNA